MSLMRLLKRIKACLFTSKEPAVVRARKAAAERARQTETKVIELAERTLRELINKNSKGGQND